MVVNRSSSSSWNYSHQFQLMIYNCGEFRFFILGFLSQISCGGGGL